MRIKSYQMETSKEVGKEFLVISDLNVSESKDIKRLGQLERKIASFYKKSGGLDGIFVLGNVISSTNVLRLNKPLTEAILDFMKFLGTLAPTYIASGGHDISFSHGDSRFIDYEAFYYRFLRVISGFNGIRLLDNTTEELEDGYTVSVYNPSFDYVKGGNGMALLNTSEVEKYRFLQVLDSDQFNTLLCHYPNVFRFFSERGILDKINLGITTQNLGLNQSYTSTGSDTIISEGAYDLSDQTTLLVNPTKDFSAPLNKELGMSSIELMQRKRTK